MSSPFEGYYGHHASVTLAKPVCLVGFCGAPVVSVAQSVAALTGLSVVDIDREVEHQLGRSLLHERMTLGSDRIERAMGPVLDAALRRRPAAVIALGESALLDASARDQVLARSTLIYLRLTAFELRHRLQELQRDRLEAVSLPELARGADLTVDDVATSLASRLPGYRAAHLTLDAMARSPVPVARDVLAAVQ